MAESVIVADYIVWKALKQQQSITYLKLRQVMFLLNLKYRKENYDSLITQQQFIKYPYGPYIRQINDIYGSKFGTEPITYIPDYNYLTKENDEYTVIKYQFDHHDLRKEQREFIDNNLNHYLDIDQWQLLKIIQDDPEYKNQRIGTYNLQNSIKYFTQQAII